MGSQNIVPVPLVALEKNGTQDIYISPNAVEVISALGTNYTSYYDAKGFNWKKYAAAKASAYNPVAFQGLVIIWLVHRY
jgi:hypothetical protein